MTEFELHHVAMYVRDADASADFYIRALGLEEVPNRVGRDTIRWFKLDGHRTLHLIGRDPEAERARQMSNHLALATRSFDAVLKRLDDAGVVYVNLVGEAGRASRRADGVRQIYFQDPDAHWVEINDCDGEP